MQTGKLQWKVGNESGRGKSGSGPWSWRGRWESAARPAWKAAHLPRRSLRPGGQGSDGGEDRAQAGPVLRKVRLRGRGRLCSEVESQAESRWGLIASSDACEKV